MPDQLEIYERMIENKNSVTDARMMASPPKIRASDTRFGSVNKSEVSIDTEDAGESGSTALTKSYQPAVKRAHS